MATKKIQTAEETAQVEAADMQKDTLANDVAVQTEVAEVVGTTEVTADQAADAQAVPFKEKFKKFCRRAWDTMKHSWGWTTIAVVGIALVLYMVINDFMM